MGVPALAFCRQTGVRPSPGGAFRVLRGLKTGFSWPENPAVTPWKDSVTGLLKCIDTHFSYMELAVQEKVGFLCRKTDCYSDVSIWHSAVSAGSAGKYPSFEHPAEFLDTDFDRLDLWQTADSARRGWCVAGWRKSRVNPRNPCPKRTGNEDFRVTPCLFRGFIVNDIYCFLLTQITMNYPLIGCA